MPIEKPEDINFILGQAHFIKTVEDLYETLVTAIPGLEFDPFPAREGGRLI